MWFLIEAAMHCYIIKVFLGTESHMSFTCYEKDPAKFSKMGEQVALAMVREATNHQRLDNVKETSP